MAFRLIVTRPNGTQTQSTADPLATRDDVGMDAMRFLAKQNIPFGPTRLAFGRRFRDVAIGETLEHQSGYSFRMEEF